MISEAAKELFALANLICGGFLFLFLLIYLLASRPRRWGVAAALLAVVFLCILNALAVYFLV